MADVFLIGAQPLTLAAVAQLTATETPIALSTAATERIVQAERYLLDKLAASDRAYYGINTGFGALASTRISDHDLGQLQHNLVMSHACGTGEAVPAPIVRLMLLLKIQSLAYGHSGAHLATVQRLTDFYNHDVLPVVYTQGSLGASGDLAPLAHLSLPLIGMGQVHWRDEKIAGAALQQKFGWPPLQLGPKEGLALLNGTQFMTAYGMHTLQQCQQLLHWADVIAALSLEGYDGLAEPFLPHIHHIKQHAGPRMVAAHMLKLLQGSAIQAHQRAHVQDPYSLRCAPQVHGAVRDAVAFAVQTFEHEINSVSDNPNIFPTEDLILSGGNFHGQPLAIALDLLALVMGQLGGISERRSYLLLSGQRGLPPFLAAEPGLNSGLMIAQYTAAALVNENAQLSNPHSAYSITSSNGQEDFVSMGANAAVRTLRVVHNVHTLLAIELLCASQALSFRKEKSSQVLESILADFRTQVPPAQHDRVVSEQIKLAQAFLLQQPMHLL